MAGILGYAHSLIRGFPMILDIVGLRNKISYKALPDGRSQFEISPAEINTFLRGKVPFLVAECTLEETTPNVKTVRIVLEHDTTDYASIPQKPMSKIVSVSAPKLVVDDEDEEDYVPHQPQETQYFATLISFLANNMQFEDIRIYLKVKELVVWLQLDFKTLFQTQPDGPHIHLAPLEYEGEEKVFATFYMMPHSDQPLSPEQETEASKIFGVARLKGPSSDNFLDKLHLHFTKLAFLVNPTILSDLLKLLVLLPASPHEDEALKSCIQHDEDPEDAFDDALSSDEDDSTPKLCSIELETLHLVAAADSDYQEFSMALEEGLVYSHVPHLEAQVTLKAEVKVSGELTFMVNHVLVTEHDWVGDGTESRSKLLVEATCEDGIRCHPLERSVTFTDLTLRAQVALPTALQHVVAALVGLLPAPEVEDELFNPPLPDAEPTNVEVLARVTGHHLHIHLQGAEPHQAWRVDMTRLQAKKMAVPKSLGASQPHTLLEMYGLSLTLSDGQDDLLWLQDVYPEMGQSIRIFTQEAVPISLKPMDAGGPQLTAQFEERNQLGGPFDPQRIQSESGNEEYRIRDARSMAAWFESAQQHTKSRIDVMLCDKKVEVSPKHIKMASVWMKHVETLMTGQPSSLPPSEPIKKQSARVHDQVITFRCPHFTIQLQTPDDTLVCIKLTQIQGIIVQGHLSKEHDMTVLQCQRLTVCEGGVEVVDTLKTQDPENAIVLVTSSAPMGTRLPCQLIQLNHLFVLEQPTRWISRVAQLFMPLTHSDPKEQPEKPKEQPEPPQAKRILTLKGCGAVFTALPPHYLVFAMEEMQCDISEMNNVKVQCNVEVYMGQGVPMLHATSAQVLESVWVHQNKCISLAVIKGLVVDLTHQFRRIRVAIHKCHLAPSIPDLHQSILLFQALAQMDWSVDLGPSHGDPPPKPAEEPIMPSHITVWTEEEVGMAKLVLRQKSKAAVQWSEAYTSPDGQKPQIKTGGNYIRNLKAYSGLRDKKLDVEVACHHFSFTIRDKEEGGAYIRVVLEHTLFVHQHNLLGSRFTQLAVKKVLGFDKLVEKRNYFLAARTEMTSRKRKHELVVVMHDRLNLDRPDLPHARLAHLKDTLDYFAQVAAVPGPPPSDLPQPAPGPPPFYFERVYLTEVDMIVYYSGKGSVSSTDASDPTKWILALAHVNNGALKLQERVWLGLESLQQVQESIMGVISAELVNLAQSVAGIQFFTKLFHSVVAVGHDLHQQRYHRLMPDVGNVVRELGTGFFNVLVGLTSLGAQATQSSSDGLSVYRQQPPTMVDGIKKGYQTLAHQFVRHRNDVEVVDGPVDGENQPEEETRTVLTGTRDAIHSVFKALLQFNQGIRNQLNPHHNQQILDNTYAPE